MPFFSKNKYEGKPPHEWYPEILHWKEGDEVNCGNIYKAIGYSKVSTKQMTTFSGPTSPFGYPTERFKYKSVDVNGMIFLEDSSGHLHRFEFWRFIKVSENLSLRSREVEQGLVNSKSYMQLIQNFQSAFNQLQKEDNHPKRLGSSEE
jgi:hypothetical protein